MEIKNIYVNGDSFAWGYELEHNTDERFSRLVSNHFNVNEINDSKCGIPNGHIFSTTKQYINDNEDKIKNTFFIIVLTDFSRTTIKDEYVYEEKRINTIPSKHSEYNNPTIQTEDDGSGTGLKTVKTIKSIKPKIPLDKIETVKVKKWNGISEIDKKLLKFGEELLLIQDLFIDNDLNYMFIDGFTSYGSILSYKELLRLNYWKQKYYKKYFGETIDLSFRGFKNETLREFKKMLSNVNNILYPNDELTIFDLQIKLDDIMPNGHPGKITHRVLANNIINKMRTVYE